MRFRTKRETGAEGEQLAADYLRKKGYTILGRNVRCGCEMDIVCAQGDRVCFVEVKTRTGDRYGAGREAVNAGRQERYRAGAVLFLKRNGLVGCPVRFDVIEITDGRVVHLENAF